MDRTSAANRVNIGGGRWGYRDRNLGTGVKGTALIAADRNAIQEELMAVIEAAGLAPNPTDWTQVLAALRAMYAPGLAFFAATGTFTVPAGITRVKVRGWGGGGGGGGTGGASAAAGGGDGGGYFEGVFAVTPGSNVAVTIGAGGSAGSNSGGNGGNGGTTSFGAVATATGGKGGTGAPSGIGINSPAPGTGTGGQIAINGLSGSNGVFAGTVYFAGQGGYSHQGSFTRALGNGQPGEGGVFPGGGGGGSAGGAFTGGAGAAGFLIVEW